MKDITVRVATKTAGQFAKIISTEMHVSAIARGIGIARRLPVRLLSK